MRRVLLGGLGIVLGMFARPAFAQEIPGRPALPDPVKRAAGLGRPVAMPDTSGNESAVTPAGLTARGQVAPAGRPVVMYPGYPGMPVSSSGVPLVTPPPGGTAPPPASPLPPPRAVGGAPPMVTEVRDPAATLGMPGGAVLVPSVGPMPGGVPYPQPSLDDPLFGGACPADGRPGFPAMNRLFGVTTNKAWMTSELLMWWTRSTQLPTLLTTSSPAFNGIPNTGDTIPVFGGSFGNTLHGGARFGAGYWFGDDQVRGVDARFTFLFRNGSEFTTNTSVYPLLARPFINANSPTGPFAEVVGAPGLANGAVAIQLQNSLWGAEVNYRRNLLGCTPCARLDGLVGFRYLNLKEQLTVTETFARTPNSPFAVGVPVNMGMITDRFRTENNFYGGQIGLTGEVRRGRWFVDGRASIALGTVSQTAEIAGQQALAFPNGSYQVVPGGLLAVPGANIGTFRQNKFAVLPEAGINLGYHVTPHLRVFVGYNFLYLSSVLRPGDVIDPVIDAARIPNFPLPGNPAPLPGFTRPNPIVRNSDFWAQGISVGVQYTW